MTWLSCLSRALGNSSRLKEGRGLREPRGPEESCEPRAMMGWSMRQHGGLWGVGRQGREGKGRSTGLPRLPAPSGVQAMPPPFRQLQAMKCWKLDEQRELAGAWSLALSSSFWGAVGPLGHQDVQE